MTRLPYMTDLERVNAENKGYPMPPSSRSRLSFSGYWLKITVGMIVAGVVGLALFAVILSIFSAFAPTFDTSLPSNTPVPYQSCTSSVVWPAGIGILCILGGLYLLGREIWKMWCNKPMEG